MKIIFSGYHNPHFFTATEYLENAIRKLGHILVSFDDHQFIFPGRLRARIKFLNDYDLRRLNRKFLDLALSHRPELCFVAGGFRTLADTVKRLQDEGIKTALLIIDAFVDFKPLLDALPYYDFVFCGGTEAIDFLNKNGIKNAAWLPFACDPQHHKPVQLDIQERQSYSHDIVFVGSFYPNRAEILSQLFDFNLGIWGPGWEKIPKNHPLRKYITIGNIKPEEWIKIYSAAKIVIVIHYQDKKNPCHQASPKVYEGLACNCFVLVDNQRDVRALFEDGKHLVIFKDIDDLRGKIAYYLAHSQERINIAQSGYSEVMHKHTYLHRLQSMLNTVKGKAC